jgi:hypothetical protein
MHVIRIAVASVGLLSFSLSSQAADTTHSVIPAGNTAALGTPAVPAQDTPQAKILSEALSKDTRATLQQAMNSSAN